MSTAGTLTFPPEYLRPASPRPAHPLGAFVRRLAPEQGWIAFLLLLAALQSVAWLVTDASWVETPGLTMILFTASATGLLLSRASSPSPILHVVGLAVGLVVVLWQISSLTAAAGAVGHLDEVASRLGAWYEAATTGGISTDLLPFSISVMAVAWVLGYLGSWSIFRNTNVWIAVVLGGVAMLTVLSFLPRDIEYTSRFFLFVFVAMLLVVRVGSIQRHRAWRAARVRFEPSASLLILHAAAWLSALVLLAAVLLPLRTYVSRPLARAWNTGRAPVAALQDDFARLFGGLPSRKDIAGRFFGSSLPFLSGMSFAGDVVLTADTEFPTYWATRTYAEYTSQGWKTGITREIQVGPETLPPAQGDAFGRVSVPQTVRLGFDTSDALAGGDLRWVSRPVVLEVLAPQEFAINALDSSGDDKLPEDVRRIAAELRPQLATAPDLFIESFISRRLPGDLALVEVTTRQDADNSRVVEGFILTRKEPLTQDVVSWRFAESAAEGEVYSILSSVSAAADADLRAAGTDYPAFIKDHYLQLPPTVPARVLDKANELAGAATTPLDKVLAVQRYLRGPALEYSEVVQPLPPKADGVDHFLFVTRKGYSDYYASAMAVMLRAVGVPARLAGGYAPGADDGSGGRAVKDSDSHTWVQVYFPGFGWLDFEPSPRWPEYRRPTVQAQGDGEPRPDALGRESSGRADPFDEEFLSGAGGPDAVAGRGVEFPRWAAVALASAAGVVALLALVVAALWNMGLRHASAPERLYTKMNRLGAAAGVARRLHQTPNQYAAAVGNAVPRIASAAQAVASAYAAARYAGRGPAPAHSPDAADAWRSVRAGLLAHALSRLWRWLAPAPSAGGVRGPAA